MVMMKMMMMVAAVMMVNGHVDGDDDYGSGGDNDVAGDGEKLHYSVK